MLDRSSATFADVQSDDTAGRRFDRLLLHVVDAGLAGCIFVVPMLMGGRQALGHLALVTLAVIVFLAWTLRQCLRADRSWRWTAGDLVLGAGAGLLLVQWAPLPPSVLTWLTPHAAGLLPLWTENADPSLGLGVWPHISLTPSATRAALVIFLAYALLFATAVQRIRRIEDVERLLRWCAMSAVLMAAFGLVQLVTSNGKFFWFYEHPYSSTADVAKGSFTNRNHFAHFLALGIGPLTWWILHKERRKRPARTTEFVGSSSSTASEFERSFRVIGLGIVLFAGLLSLSRGGMLAMLVAAGVSVAVSYRASAIGIRFVAGLGAVGLLTGVALMVFGYDRVANRVDNLASGSIEELDARAGRRNIWEATAKAAADYWMLGSGAGSLRRVYPMYIRAADDRLFYTHAENGPLQVALETGVAGLALAIVGILLCAFWCIAGLRNASSGRVLVCVGAVAAALAANLLHSLFDFVWYVPGCMVLVALLAACACRLRRLAGGQSLERAGQVRLPRLLGLTAVLAVLVLGAWMIYGRVGQVVAERGWFHYLRVARAPAEPEPVAAASAEPRKSAPSRSASRAVEIKDQKLIDTLEEVVRWAPDHLEAHLRLAESYLGLFNRCQQTAFNAMPLGAVSETAIHARFASRQALDAWLSRALGANRIHLDRALDHARRALSLCPLAGEGYLYLGELCFLEGGSAAAKAACVRQAFQVRPNDGKVLFHAGRQAALAADFDQAMKLWRRAFHAGKVYQADIIEGLAGRIRPDDPRQEIQILLEVFRPDLHGFRLFHAIYAKSVPPESLIGLRWPYAQLAEAEAAKAQGKAAAELWVEAMVIYRQLNEHGRAAQCGLEGLRCDYNHYWLHFHLAQCLAAKEQFAEAEKHLRWCLRRKPGDRTVEQLLQKAVEKRIAGQGRLDLASRKGD